MKEGTKMIYVLFGVQGLILENQCKKILKENLGVLDEFHYVKYSLYETSIDDILFDAELPSLTGENKAIVVYNSFFLASDKPKEKIKVDHNFDLLSKYLDTPNPSCDIIFIFETDKLLEKSVLVKKLKNIAKIIEAKEITKEEWPLYIKKYLARLNVTIDDDAAEQLAVRVQGDALRFTNEAKKLSLYRNHLTINDIELMVARPLEENAFAIFDFLLKKKKNEALKIYRDLLMENEEPVRLISLLANQFRLLSEIDYLTNQYSSNYDIAKVLGIHEYRVKLGKGHLKNISITKVLNTLDSLYRLDYEIKSGKVDRFFAFEMFLLKF